MPGVRWHNWDRISSSSTMPIWQMNPSFRGSSAFMESGPVVVMILEGDNVIKKIRKLVGPTDSEKAPAGTIRGDYGDNAMRNVVHASDSPESARAEIRRFFNEDDFQI